jgi:hypothetical protein
MREDHEPAPPGPALAHLRMRACRLRTRYESSRTKNTFCAALSPYTFIICTGTMTVWPGPQTTPGTPSTQAERSIV